MIFYHKNAKTIYNPDWIQRCYRSINQQSYQDFDVFELDYGGKDNRLFEGMKGKYIHFNIEMENHIEAMNFMISACFKSGYDVVFNTNIDDWYHFERFEKQLAVLGPGKNDLVSSNFYYAETDSTDKIIITKNMNMVAFGDIGHQLKHNHNVVAHPCVAMHRNFWDDDLHYNDLVGYEDLDLWQRAHEKGKKIHILEDYLLYYRIHDKQITKKYKGK